MEKLHPRAHNFAASVLCYDETRFTDYIPFIFPKCTFQFDKHKHGAFYHGVIFDPATRHITAVLRGTDHDKGDVIGDIEAWAVNFCGIPDDDGFHPGFREVVEDFIRSYIMYFRDAKTVTFTGHSQGGGTGKLGALFASERFKNIERTHFEVYADPPSVNKKGSWRFDTAAAAGRMMGIRCMVPGDPIGTRLLRMRKLLLPDGVDVGVTEWLPDVLGPHKDSALSLYGHSPHAYCLAKMWQEIQKKENGIEPDIWYLESLDWIMNRLVN
jgi:hypothetical protein